MAHATNLTPRHDKSNPQKPSGTPKKWRQTAQGPLCATGAVLQSKKVFEPIHQGVSIDQKNVVYRPTDKLVFAAIGMLSGAQTVSEINTTVRPDTVLLNAFGYSRCADQSVIQQTLDAATETTVSELEAALNRIREPHTQTDSDGVGAGDVLCVDMDLSALPVSKRAEGAEKGYVAKQKINTLGNWRG